MTADALDDMWAEMMRRAAEEVLSRTAAEDVVVTGNDRLILEIGIAAGATEAMRVLSERGLLVKVKH